MAQPYTTTELKRELRKEISTRLGTNKYSNIEIKDLVQKTTDELLKSKKIKIEDEEKGNINTSLLDDFLGLGPLKCLLEDKEITEIMVNGPDRIFIEKNGKIITADKCFDDNKHLRIIMEKMILPTGRRIDESSPYVDFSLDDGSRVNVIIPPLAVDGIAITIRKFLSTINTLEDLVDLGSLDKNMASFLNACIKARLNILISGATGSGKTTTLAVLSKEIEPAERIVTIEDSLELSLDKQHIVRLVTRNKNISGRGEVKAKDLFTNSLRMRPNRIILGEIRGEEAMDFLQAINSGFSGNLAILHASTPANAIGRLETMAMYTSYKIPNSEIKKQISYGLDLIIQQKLYNDGIRRISYITEVLEISDGDIRVNDIFRYITDGNGLKGRDTGFKVCNKPEKILGNFKEADILFDETVFS